MTIPHVVILHLCTDASERIAESARASGQPVRIVKYDVPVSRPGYETLVTPASHSCSLVSFYTFSYGQRRYEWIFKWDADFEATDALIHYLNNDLPYRSAEKFKIRIPCLLGDSRRNVEVYLFNGFDRMEKCIFWEVACNFGSTITIEATIQSIDVAVTKSYWREAPWFANGVNSDLESKYEKVVNMFGKEPTGMAKASNPECDEPFRAVISRQHELYALGIDAMS